VAAGALEPRGDAVALWVAAKRRQVNAYLAGPEREALECLADKTVDIAYTIERCMVRRPEVARR
jgi:hypothetical protein